MSGPSPERPHSIVIDTHTHLMPGRLARKIRDFFDQHLHDGLAYPSDPDVVVHRHAGDAVSEMWNLPYAHTGLMSAQLNADVAELSARLSTDRMTVRPGCTTHPDDETPSETVGRAITEHGAIVCKLHCSVGRFAVDDPRLDPVYDVLARHRVPAVIHLGHDVSGATHDHEVEPLLTVVGRHPDTTIIAAHCGHTASPQVFAAMADHRNLWADTAPVVDVPIPIAAAVRMGLADRILLGSDAPNVAIPLGDQLDHLRAECGDDAAAFAAITGDNAASLVADVRR